MAETRTALITGANRGIGKETANMLAQRDFRVVIASREHEKGQQAAKEIDGSVEVLTVDVGSTESIQQAAVTWGDRTLDVLINNAGIYPDGNRTIFDISRQQMHETFETNVIGPLEMVQAFLPALRRSSAARIINVSSGYGQLDGMNHDVPSYCLSKLTLNGITIMLADKLRSENIAINSVCPGWVRTDMGGEGATRSVSEGAETIVWLASEASHELTGKFFRDRKEIDW